MSGSDYLKLGTSPADIIAAAELLRAKGETLSADLEGLLATVAERETDKTLGTDDFGREFKKTYEKVEDGKTTTDAAKDSARAVASAAGNYGGAVSTSMQDYLTTDAQNAADINSVTE